MHYSDIASRIEALNEKGVIAYKTAVLTLGSEEVPLYCLTAGKQRKPKVFLSAGIHGDEPAGIYAVLDFFENDYSRFSQYFRFTVFPCLNPLGLQNGSRRDIGDYDLNREFLKSDPEQVVKIVRRFLGHDPAKYRFALNMHEDNTKEKVEGFELEDNPLGFYMYELSPKDKRKGHTVIRALEKRRIPVCKEKKVYGEKNDNGVIWSRGIFDPEFEDGETLEGYINRFTDFVFTTETPTCWNLNRRVEAHNTALETLLEEFK